MDYRVTTQDTTGYSPSQLLFGKQMRLPIETDYEAREGEDWDKAIKKRITQLDLIEMNQVKASEKIKAKQQKMKERYDKGIKKKKTFEIGEQVLLYGPKSSKLATTGVGPYKIISKGRYNSYELELGGIRTWQTGTRLDHFKDRGGNVRIEI